jgi:1-acyl-sn-glycerol-3-phosphate acyltransferase
MSTTIFDTPVLSPLLRVVSLITLKMMGWKLSGELPQDHRFVMIAHPHTSNIDLPMMLAVAFIYKMKLHWIGKEEIFSGWRRPIMTWMGGLPIVRSGTSNEVERTALHFKDRKKIALAVAPVGTRAKTPGWRSGFYWIAVNAKVPILLSFLDYKAKHSGVGDLFMPTGDFEKDVAEIKKFYEGMEGKFPEKT